MLVDKQSELMSDLFYTVHKPGGDDLTWKRPIVIKLYAMFLLVSKFKMIGMVLNVVYGQVQNI